MAAAAPPDPERAERTAVFERTKMCKFFILGVCAKGTSCRFAHDPSDLQDLPDLARTKLCKSLISTGSCNNPDCRYAHNKEEIRAMPVPGPTVKKPGPDEANRPRPLVPGKVTSSTVAAAPLNGSGQYGLGVMDSASATLEAGTATPPLWPQQPEALSSVMQAALVQMGQAAQAHAAEAARLQAMAAQLKGMLPNPGLDGSPGFSPFMGLPGGQTDPNANAFAPPTNGLLGSGGYFFQPSSSPTSRGMSAGTGPTLSRLGATADATDASAPVGGLMPTLTVKNTFLDFADPGTPLAPLRLVKTAQAALCTLGGDSTCCDSPLSDSRTPGEGNLGFAMSRALAGEPVQIMPESLRSMSSHSMALECLQEEDDEVTSGFGAQPNTAWPTTSPMGSSTSPLRAPLPAPTGRLRTTLSSLTEEHDPLRSNLHSLGDDRVPWLLDGGSATGSPITPGPLSFVEGHRQQPGTFVH